VLNSLILSAQTNSVIDHYIRPETAVGYPAQTNYLENESRIPLYLPEVDGYVLLKADLHLHTIFSDGTIWPITRVEEAFRDGLDVMAITDHLEFHHINNDKVHSEDLNAEYNIAKKLAAELGIILIPGAEVTRDVPAGHYCLLFLNDANKLKQYINPDNPYDTLTLEATLQAAKDLGCFITWNHPAYKNPKKIAEWGAIHQRLYNKGLFQGIEIVNSNLYIPLVQQWAMEKGLTMLSNSDSHSSIRYREGQHRPMTIILAKERSIDAVKEALFAGRTVGFSNNYLYGKEEYVKPIFQNSIKSRVLSSTEKSVIIELRNTSGIPYELNFMDNEFLSPSSTNKNIVIYANETIAVRFTPKRFKATHGEIRVKVNNININAAVPLNTIIKYSL